MIDKERQSLLIKQVKQLISELDKKAIEREELIRLLVLAIFSKSHMFLIGVPGVGKTYIINIALQAIKNTKYFEYLVMAQTKPEEIFGTMFTSSDGRLEYDIEGSVLDSHFVMLDEMFKGESSILNSLLGVTSNERTFFMRGRGAVRVPLMTMFGASNEFPKDEALEPFDDRLLLRYEVERIKNPENYKRFIRGDFDKNKEVHVELSVEDIEYTFADAQNIELPEEIVETYLLLKQNIIVQGVKASDRKMLTALNNILKVSAYLNGRGSIDYSDLFLIVHIAWRNFEERRKITSIVFQVIFGDNKQINKELAELEQISVALKDNMTYKLGDFLYKRIPHNMKDIESFYSSHIEAYNQLSNNISALKQRHNKLEEIYVFNRQVERMVRDNYLLVDYKQNVFLEAEVSELQRLKENINKMIFVINIFAEHCTDAYAYAQFIPGHYYTVD